MSAFDDEEDRRLLHNMTAAAQRRAAAREQRQAERAQQQQDIDRGIAERRERRANDPPPPPRRDAKEIRAYLDMYAGLVGRRIGWDVKPNGGKLPIDTTEVVQRCRACCAEIVGRVLWQWLDADGWQQRLAHLVRHSYDSHRCADVELSMHGCTNEELDELLASAERDLERNGKRCDELRRAFDAQLERMP